jgi:heptosyltransferase-2
MPYHNILVRSTNWVGDAVMSLPALQQLRACHPEARISVLAKPWVAALYARESFCDELIPYAGSLAKRLATAVTLRTSRFDCALLLQNAFEAAAAAWLARIPVRIGYNRDGRGWLLTRAIPVPAKSEIPRHQRFYYLELLKRAALIDNYDDHGESSPIRMAGANAAAAAGQLRLQGLISAQTAVGVSPGAAYGSAKRWLPERFAAAAIQLARDAHCAVLVLGSQSEHEICEQVQKLIAAAGIECVNLAGKTTLEAFIEIAAACRLVLTNDSGAMHISSALGVPTVTIFGPTDEAATGPTGPLARIVRQPVECSPCLLRECPIDHRCMTRVDAERVARTALEVLRG